MLTACDDADQYLVADGSVEMATLLRALNRARKLFCPHCRRAVGYRHGTIRIPYFAHRAAACDAGSTEPDGTQHRAMKLTMYRWLKQRYPEAHVALEVRIENGQRADVLAQWPTGQRVAIEVQYAPLSPEVWNGRHRGYQAAGIKDVWLLHRSRWPRNMVFRPDPVAPPLRAIGVEEAQARLPALVEAIQAASQPVLVLDPDPEQLDRAAIWLVTAEPIIWWGEFRLTRGIAPLDQCRLRRGTIIWDAWEAAWRELDAERDAEIAEAARRSTANVQQAAATVQAARQAAQAAIAAREEFRQHQLHSARAALQHRQAQLIQLLRQWRVAMPHHPAWHNLVQIYQLDPDPAKLHPIFGAVFPEAALVPVDARLWQACLYYAYVEGVAGHRVDVRLFAEDLQWRFALPLSPNDPALVRLAYRYQRYLREVGVLGRAGDLTFKTPLAALLHDPERCRTFREQAMHETREHLARDICRQFDLITVRDILTLEPSQTTPHEPG